MEFIGNTRDGRLYSSTDYATAFKFSEMYGVKVESKRKGYKTYFVTI